jgi:hypothetical protein
VEPCENPSFTSILFDGTHSLLEFQPIPTTLTALFSKTAQTVPLRQERGLLAWNRQIFATAIATDQPIAYYRYPSTLSALIPLLSSRFFQSLRQRADTICANLSQTADQWHQR